MPGAYGMETEEEKSGLQGIVRCDSSGTAALFASVASWANILNCRLASTSVPLRDRIVTVAGSSCPGLLARVLAAQPPTL